MSKVNQKEAVFKAVCNVTGHKGEGQVSITKEQRAQVSMILFEGFRSESIELDRTYDDAGLKAYISGLVSNWLRKDKRLNGGVTYVAKNPGSRQGSADPQLKAMRTLLSTLTDEEQRQEVQGHIDQRIAEINSAKMTKVIDFSALPAELQAKFGK
jgi:hypothetical protein